MKIDRSALAAIVLLAASFFLGAAAILVTPPFEGADETAHYSYIQQLADTGHAPVPGKDGLSRDLDRYEGPMRYNDSAPFEATGKATYRRFGFIPPRSPPRQPIIRRPTPLTGKPSTRPSITS